jgi:hypothetical protein
VKGQQEKLRPADTANALTVRAARRAEQQDPLADWVHAGIPGETVTP